MPKRRGWPRPFLCLGGSDSRKFKSRVHLGEHSFAKAKGCRAENRNG